MASETEIKLHLVFVWRILAVYVKQITEAEMDVLLAPVPLTLLWHPSLQCVFHTLIALGDLSLCLCLSPRALAQLSAVPSDTPPAASWGGSTRGQLEILFSCEMYYRSQNLSCKSWVFTKGSKAYVYTMVWGRINIWPCHLFRCGVY